MSARLDAVPRDPMEGIRRSIEEREARLRAKALPDCNLCRGRGQTSGHIAPSKCAFYACPCTGEPDWQRDTDGLLTQDGDTDG